MRKKYVYADLPRTGLCNMLFPWARAALYARDHGCEMIAPQWIKLNRIGPWLRGEKDKRYYTGQFTNEGYITGLRRWLLLHFSSRVNRMSGMANYFADIKGESDYLRAALLKITMPQIKEALEKLPKQFIGVHIRRGDFARIELSLPDKYYVAAIETARSKMGDLPICVFSDARPGELPYLSQFSNLRLMESAPALQDMLSLSRSSCLVATNKSTFSAWAAFLGGMPSFWSRSGEPPSSCIAQTIIL